MTTEIYSAIAVSAVEYWPLLAITEDGAVIVLKIVPLEEHHQ